MVDAHIGLFKYVRIGTYQVPRRRHELQHVVFNVAQVNTNTEEVHFLAVDTWRMNDVRLGHLGCAIERSFRELDGDADDAFHDQRTEQMVIRQALDIVKGTVGSRLSTDRKSSAVTGKPFVTLRELPTRPQIRQ